MIGFRRMEMADLPAMHRWLNTEHVRRWFRDEGRPYETVVAKYAPRIRGEEPTRSYLILRDGAPIGYIQAYFIADYPDYARWVQPEEGAAGVDMFIGEPGCVHRGLGPEILRRFLREVVFGEMGAACCLVGPEPGNRAAIRAYEKAGFRYLKTVRVPDEPEPEYLMRIGREEACEA